MLHRSTKHSLLITLDFVKHSDLYDRKICCAATTKPAFMALFKVVLQTRPKPPDRALPDQ
jgi:hypothetical protein